MHRTILRTLMPAVWWGGCLVMVALAGDPATKPAAPAARVVIPFDFESRFDDGQYGQAIGDMVWKKLQRQGGFVLPESMLDVREWCQRNKFLPRPDTPLEKMKTIVRKEQGGHIGIWGKVERAPGHDTDVYDLWICVADFSSEPPRMIYKNKVRTKTVSEIPHVYIKEALDCLSGRTAPVVTRPDPAVEERWRTGRNLVQGDFEKGRAAPAGWDPLPAHVTWVLEPGQAKNHIVRFTIPPDVAETTGVLYYSNYFPIEAGATYRFQCRWRSSGSAVKVFIKCYDEVPSKFRGKAGPSAGMERREVYRSQQNLEGKPNTWNVHAEEFTPEHAQYRPRWGRVMLYAYYPAGTVEWDDVVVKQIAPPPTPTKQQEVRPSR
jgi:hypothetical protein